MTLSLTTATYGPDDDAHVYVDPLGSDNAILTITATPARHVTLVAPVAVLQRIVVAADTLLNRLANEQADHPDG